MSVFISAVLLVIYVI